MVKKKGIFLNKNLCITGAFTYRKDRNRPTVGTGQSDLNILTGFDTQFLAGSLEISVDLTRMLQNQNDQRGQIVNAQIGIQDIAYLTSRGQYKQQKEGVSVL